MQLPLPRSRARSSWRGAANCGDVARTSVSTAARGADVGLTTARLVASQAQGASACAAEAQRQRHVLVVIYRLCCCCRYGPLSRGESGDTRASFCACTDVSRHLRPPCPTATGLYFGIVPALLLRPLNYRLHVRVSHAVVGTPSLSHQLSVYWPRVAHSTSRVCLLLSSRTLSRVVHSLPGCA